MIAKSFHTCHPPRNLTSANILIKIKVLVNRKSYQYLRLRKKSYIGLRSFEICVRFIFVFYPRPCTPFGVFFSYTTQSSKLTFSFNLMKFILRKVILQNECHFRLFSGERREAQQESTWLALRANFSSPITACSAVNCKTAWVNSL